MITKKLFGRELLGAGMLAALTAVQGASAAPLARFKAFEGNVNIAGTQVSLRTKHAGKGACDISASDSASLTLPAGATITSAQLYWAGSGSTVDSAVTVNGKTVTAPAERRYTSSKDGYAYFAAAADITSLLPFTPSGTQTFTLGALTVANGSPYCSKNPNDNVVLAGFSLMVVYAHKDEKYRTVNLYEGFQAMRNESVTVAMGDYTPRTSADPGRFGYIVWEGDRTGQQKGDTVTYAGSQLTNGSFAVNDNAFNSKSSVNNDENSYGVDFDIFNLSSVPADKANSKAVFKTEGDLVLLGAAALAAPSAPSSDLAIAKTQSGNLRVGETVDYTLAVTNNGPGPDRNFVVEDVLPDSLEYVSAAGTGWSCSVAGQKITCTHAGDLQNGGTATVMIKAKVRTAGEVSNTATVKGTNDTNTSNNSSTTKGNASSPVVATGPYVFTKGMCPAGQAILPSTSSGACALFAGPVVAGSKPTLYITKAANNISQAFSATSISLGFALQCNNPTAAANVTPKIVASVEDQALPVCGANSADPAVIAASPAKPITVIASDASVGVKFTYPDVGEVTLLAKTGATIGGQATFVSIPARIDWVSIKRVDGNVDNPESDAMEEVGFAEVGEPFRVALRALPASGTALLPNFGNEIRSDSTKFLDGALALETQDLAAATYLKTVGGWQGNGELTRDFTWDRAGFIRLKPALTYLGGTKIATDDPRIVGRFYPSYFTTETSGGFACLKNMTCPTAAQLAVEQATYSERAFKVGVKAFGRNGEITPFDTSWIQPITLKAAKAPGSAEELTGLTSTVDKTVERDASFRLAIGFNAKAPKPVPPLTWTKPTAIYLRASAPENRAGKGPITISSRRVEPAPSVEDGIMVVNGRLLVGNVIGSPQLRTPIPMRAQFFSGAGNWENNTAFDDDEVVQAANVEFTSCRRGLRSDPALTVPENCNLSLLQPIANLSLAMQAGGATTYILQPMRAGVNGSADVWVRTQPWLPSSIGRVTYDQYTSPVIYVREMY